MWLESDCGRLRLRNRRFGLREKCLSCAISADLILVTNWTMCSLTVILRGHAGYELIQEPITLLADIYNQRGRRPSWLFISSYPATVLVKFQAILLISSGETASNRDIREFKIWRRQRQRQRHKSMIWLVEWRKIIVLPVRHAFWCNVLT